MMGQNPGPLLSAVFIDYDNIYQSLKKKSEEAAKRFAKDSSVWLSQIESGQLITLTKQANTLPKRQLILNRCYGNPVPRRNNSDNTTDMSSFPFVRHQFLRAGMEVIDCPPLTSQLKNSAEIRIVMDMNDLISHQTRFDEFIILSGDADFTPILYRLRAHARRTIVFVNQLTAAPYSAIADGEIREDDLLNSLLVDREDYSNHKGASEILTNAEADLSFDSIRSEILSTVLNLLQNAGQPVPIDALSDRVSRSLGDEKTLGSGWAGTGTFGAFLAKELPPNLRISNQAPYYIYDVSHVPISPQNSGKSDDTSSKNSDTKDVGLSTNRDIQNHTPRVEKNAARINEPYISVQKSAIPKASVGSSVGTQNMISSFDASAQTGVQTPKPKSPVIKETSAATQQSIARIHNACQVPPLAPPEYRSLFDAMAQEIAANGLTGAQTLSNIMQRAAELGVKVRREDVRFVLEVVSESDPWFEQGATADMFSSRFRNYVIARCRNQDLQLSTAELDLIDTWFGGSSSPVQPTTYSGGQKELPSGAISYPTNAPAASMNAAFSNHYYSHQEKDLPLVLRNRS